jgi:hypothetical protein
MINLVIVVFIVSEFIENNISKTRFVFLIRHD